jgi:hypothetical protein
MTSAKLPELRPEYDPTRATLHAYAKAMGAIAREHGIPHPKWWHISLNVRPEGLTTDPIPLPDGGALAVTMDLKRHEIVLRASSGEDHRIDIGAEPTATDVGESLIAAAAGLGLEDRYERDRFDNDDPRKYDPTAAAAYYDTFVAVASIFERRRASLGERVGPVQVWPHGFDLAFEWFGTRTEMDGDDEATAQLNLGLYPGGDQAYFYSTPWPFDPAVTEASLPGDARWNTDGWNGGLLPYESARNAEDPAATITQFAVAVFEAARPSLETT